MRYDGDPRRSARVVERLGAAFPLLAECPEAGMGLGVPRPKIHLEAAPTGPRLVGSRGEELTAGGGGVRAGGGEAVPAGGGLGHRAEVPVAELRAR